MAERIRLFGIDIDPLRESEAVARLMSWIHDAPIETDPAGDQPAQRCRYVVTPNVDHTRLLQESAAFREAYADADLVVADGMPVAVSSLRLAKPLPERVSGADLVQALYAAAPQEKPLTTYLLGAGPGVAERAARNVEARWPHVKVVGTDCPPLGFEKDEAE